MKTHPNNTRSLFAVAFVAALFAIPALRAQNSSISNVKAVQRTDTKLIDITYDLDTFGASNPFIEVSISELGNGNYNLPLFSLSGAFGRSNAIRPGTGLKITWNAGADWNGKFTNQAVARVRIISTPPQVGDFALIPAGNFLMGDTFSETSDAVPTRTVFISAFYIQKTEVTIAQWDVVRVWAITRGYEDLHFTNFTNPSYPVTSISWNDAVKWCNALSEFEGRTPVYTVGGLTYRSGASTPAADNTKNGYRLPTEAEWEKAARGGNAGMRFPWGDTIDHNRANFHSSSGYTYDTTGYQGSNPLFGGQPSPVRSFLVGNGYGLFDTSGNVEEHCWDWYASNYYGTSGNTNDPTGPSAGARRVTRGGDYQDQAEGLRNFARSSTFGPFHRLAATGFRIVRRGL